MHTSPGYGSLLEELGYRPLIEPEKIISEAMKRSLATLGESFSKTLLQHLSSTYDLTEEQILGEITVIENELREILHGGANVILERVKEEIYNYIRSKNRSEAVNRYLIHMARKTEKFEDLTNVMNMNASNRSQSTSGTSFNTAIDAHAWKMMLSEVINEVLAVEAFEFIRQVPSGEHLALLYRRDITKESLISEFLSSPRHDSGGAGSNGLVSIRPTKLPSVKNLLCQDLFSGAGGQDLSGDPASSDGMIRKMVDWIASLQLEDANKQSRQTAKVRIASENTWFVENKLDKQITVLEKSLAYSSRDTGGKNNTTVLCTYDTSKVTDTQVRSLVEYHSYVILDEPLMIYRKPTSVQAEPRA